MPADYSPNEEQPKEGDSDRAPYIPLVAISDLLKARKPDKVKAAADKLAKIDPEKLKSLLRDRRTNRLAKYLINHELSARNIPPVLRGISPVDHAEEADHFAEQSDFLTIDLDWIVTRYPDQKIEFKGWQNLFSPAQFAAKAKFIFHSGNRPEWKIRRALAITREQEAELCHLQSAAISNRRAIIERLKPEVTDIVRRKRYDRNLTIETPKEQDEVRRMIDYWEAANLCDGWGQPTRAAWFYEIMTGSKSTRQQAGNIMGKLERDLGKKARLK